MYTKKIRQYLLKLARESIKKYLETGEEPVIDEKGLEPVLKEKRGVFVTITIEGRLKGCIGHIEPVQELYKDVVGNSVNAAFHDPRFDSLTENEFNQIKIEISVLSLPEPLKYSNADDLLAKLKPGTDGVILKKGYHQATYLPQVWEDTPDKEQFLGSLCQKAGMDYDEWRKSDIEVSTYAVEKFEEE